MPKLPEYIKINGRIRSLKGPSESTAEGTKIAYRRADIGRFYNARQSSYKSKKGGLTKKGVMNENFKKSIVAYAEKYASSEQAEQIRRMDAAKIGYLYETGIVDDEEVFDYSQSFNEIGAQLSKRYNQSVQDFIDRYNGLLAQGRKQEALRKREYRARKRAEGSE